MAELAVAWRDYLEDGGQTAILEDAVKNATQDKYKYGRPEIGPQRRSTDAVSTLCDAIKSRISAGGHPRVILTVYVDEVSSLSEKTLEGTSCTLYEIFLSAWVTAT
ncbi:hypothetical protein PHLGIDRAFT_375218 [Phlebiopsis gigantea 11061_1 CR5-6]|uniref:Uncharacterized protein n=1 Tax=Phlebiopsis gigantea (strain 11061_1 CR5-6) TaxID=745531 RepID=A0A0C3NTF5_PHLG1|nr:hypothetical protein PHLGIDRAFT_375218 [Phlebiopsis gigantea 11061_1 CR5-6]